MSVANWITVVLCGISVALSCMSIHYTRKAKAANRRLAELLRRNSH